MLAPYSEIAMSKDRVGERDLLRVAVEQRKLEPELPLEAARALQLRSELSIPTGRAPRRASQAET